MSNSPNWLNTNYHETDAIHTFVSHPDETEENHNDNLGSLLKFFKQLFGLKDKVKESVEAFVKGDTHVSNQMYVGYTVYCGPRPSASIKRVTARVGMWVSSIFGRDTPEHPLTDEVAKQMPYTYTTACGQKQRYAMKWGQKVDMCGKCIDFHVRKSRCCEWFKPKCESYRTRTRDEDLLAAWNGGDANSHYMYHLHIWDYVAGLTVFSMLLLALFCFFLLVFGMAPAPHSKVDQYLQGPTNVYELVPKPRKAKRTKREKELW